ncbi:hypothetical protein [Pseudomonas sp. F(2018)]|uniref:hypothetical protein n=1 Tax=Pseudomonas sp. F(2018) TaxID=2502240 RepID=UPI0010F54971|nr:hypothetical protein [Pseudomonas sp. F(2018)]
MTQKVDLSKEVQVQLPLGHLLMMWDILSSKLSCVPINEFFTEEEKRAVWSLEDLFERALVESGVSSRPQPEWDELIGRAREFAKTLPADFLD